MSLKTKEEIEYQNRQRRALLAKIASLSDDDLNRTISEYDKHLSDVEDYKNRKGKYSNNKSRFSSVRAADEGNPWFTSQSRQNKLKLRSLLPDVYVPYAGGSVLLPEAEDIYAENNKRRMRRNSESNIPAPTPAPPFMPVNLDGEGGYNPTWIKQKKPPIVFPSERYSSNIQSSNKNLEDHEDYIEPQSGSELYRTIARKGNSSSPIRGEMIPSKGVMGTAGNKFSYPQMFNTGDDYTRRAVLDLVTREAAGRSIRNPLQNSGEMRMVLQDGTVVVKKSSGRSNNDKVGWWTDPKMLERANKVTEMSRLAGRNSQSDEMKRDIASFWENNPDMMKTVLEHRRSNKEFDIRRFEAEETTRRQKIQSEGQVESAKIIRQSSDAQQLTDFAASLATQRNYYMANQAKMLADAYEESANAKQEGNQKAMAVAVEHFKRALKDELYQMKQQDPNIPDYNVNDYDKTIEYILSYPGSAARLQEYIASGKPLKHLIEKASLKINPQAQ